MLLVTVLLFVFVRRFERKMKTCVHDFVDGTHDRNAAADDGDDDDDDDDDADGDHQWCHS